MYSEFFCNLNKNILYYIAVLFFITLITYYKYIPIVLCIDFK